jgi:serine/threonine protein phosphatase PrpC
VSKFLDTGEMLAVCRDHPEPQSCAERLVATALEPGGYDNATCVVMALEWVGDGPPGSPQPPAPPRRWWQFWR